MIFKVIFLFPTILITLLFSCLSWTATFAQDSVPMTCGPYDFQISFMSAECTYVSSDRLPAGQKFYISMGQNYCCTTDANVCTTRCFTDRWGADSLNDLILKTTDGITVSTTWLDVDTECHDDPLITTSQILTPGVYSFMAGPNSAPTPHTMPGFEVVDETITFKRSPSGEQPPVEEEITGQIEGYVWVDMDGDGLRDENEPGEANVSVDLISVCWSNNGEDDSYTESRSKTVTSDSEGFFQFTDVSYEMYNRHYSYALRFSQDQEYITPNQGDDETRDSDAIASCEDYLELEQRYSRYQCIVGTTDEFSLPDEGIFLGMDAGIRSPIKNFFLPLIRLNRPVVRASESDDGNQYIAENLSNPHIADRPTRLKHSY